MFSNARAATQIPPLTPSHFEPPSSPSTPSFSLSILYLANKEEGGCQYCPDGIAAPLLSIHPLLPFFIIAVQILVLCPSGGINPVSAIAAAAASANFLGRRFGASDCGMLCRRFLATQKFSVVNVQFPKVDGTSSSGHSRSSLSLTRVSGLFALAVLQG